MLSTQCKKDESGNNAKSFLESLKRAKAEGMPENTLLVEVSSSHCVNCSEKLFIPHISKDRIVSWTFTVTSSSRFSHFCQLKHVFTLDANLPEFSITNVSAVDRPILTLNHGCQEWQNNLPQSPEYKVTIQFVSSDYGSFYQRLVFGFETSPKIVRYLGVMVAPEASLIRQLSHERPSSEDNELNWLEKYELVTFDGKPHKGPEQSPYKVPPNLISGMEYGAFDHIDNTLTKECYRLRLHTLLYIEELERRKQLSRLNFTCHNILIYLSQSEEYFDRALIEIPINPDILEQANHLINRSSRALIRLLPPSKSKSNKHGMKHPVLYEVIVLGLKKASIVFLTNPALYSLFIGESSALPATVCFRFVDTYKYMHSAIDRIDLECVFPSNPLGLSLEWDIERHDFLNKPQATALSHILDPRPKPPLLIFGPFGTGKTRTIAEAVKELCRLHSGNPDENLRILICTHSNSAADHYILNYLHPFFTSSELGNELCTTLRICWEDRFLKTVSSTVLKYCLISKETGKFTAPTKDILDDYRIIVTTLVTADVLTGLDLPRGYFSHVFIDEAAQAMEAETLIPLCLCVPSTRVVLAGDHLQLGAIIYSPIARRLTLDRSLLVRLYEYYPVTSSCKLLLLENYRAYQEIVDIPSKLFYEGTLVAHKTRPLSSPYPVQFYGVLGKEVRAPDLPSYYNMAEAAEISERVECLVNEWSFDGFDDVEESICVLAPYTAQVREIRQLLRKKNLGQVRVEPVNNVQGLEFSAIFISTVHSSYSMSVETIDRQDMGFLSDPRLLNTAVTRAKYRLIIVGDPGALCGAGDCKVCWRTILGKCNENGTFNYRLLFQKVMEYTKSPSQVNNNNNDNNSFIKQIAYNASMPSAEPYTTATTTVRPSEFQTKPLQTKASTVQNFTNPDNRSPDSQSPSMSCGNGSTQSGIKTQSPRNPGLAVPGSTPPCPTAEVITIQSALPRGTTFQVPTIPSPIVQAPSFPGSAVPMFQATFSRPGVVNQVLPYGPQPLLDPSGRQVIYTTNQVKIFQGQVGPVMQPMAHLPFTASMFRPGTVIAPPVQQLPGPLRFGAQAPLDIASAPTQEAWQFPTQQLMATTHPWGPSCIQTPSPQPTSVPSPTDSPLSLSGSNSPSLVGSSTSARGVNSPPVCGVGNIPRVSDSSEEETEIVSFHSPVNNVSSPSGHSLEHIIQALIYCIHCRKKMLLEEENLLVELSTNKDFPKEIRDIVLKQIQGLDKEKHLNTQRLALQNTVARKLNVDCTVSVSAAMGRAESFISEKLLGGTKKKLSLESDEEVKQLLSQASLKEKTSQIEDFEDSDSEEWFLARREDPLVQEYIKAFESFAESRKQHIDSCQSYRNISAEAFRQGTKHFGNKWFPNHHCDANYTGNTVHHEYEDEGHVFDKLLKNELVLCTLDITSPNRAFGRVIESDIKDMLMGSNIDNVSNSTDCYCQDITIATRNEMNRAFHGDIVAVRVIDKTSTEPFGRVVNVFKNVNSREFVCTVDDKDSNIMIPVNKNNPSIFVMQSREHRDLKGVSVFSVRGGEARCRALVPSHQAKGCLFLVTVLEWRASYHLPLGIVRKVFKKINDFYSLLPILAAEHGIRLSHPDDVMNEVKICFPNLFKVSENEWLSRSFRYDNAFTIDCKNNMELDKAISIVKEKGGTFSVGVHVSDVSYFVSKDSCIDKAAFAQGCSLHTGEDSCEAIPMLPLRFSQELCSFIPKQDRLAVSVIFRLNQEGQIIKPPDIHRSVVNSCCALSFVECDAILAGGKSSRNLPGNFKEELVILENLTRKIVLRQVRQGCISMAMNLIHSNAPKASQMIEQLLMMTDTAVAQRLLLSSKTKDLALLQRQLPPKVKQREGLTQWCANNGIIPNGSLMVQHLPESKDVAINEVKVALSCLGHIATAVNAQDLTQLTEALLKYDSSDERLEVLSRFCAIQEDSQYIVSAHSSGQQLKHFSLGQECYTNFTSPLSRFFDVVVHRCLLAVIYCKQFPYSLKELQDICAQCQITSARANAFKNDCKSISLANSLRSCKHVHCANVEGVSSKLLTLNCNIKCQNQTVKIQDLGPLKVEVQSEQEIVLTWIRRDVQCSSTCPSTNQTTSSERPSNDYYVKIPASAWLPFIHEVRRGNVKRINKQWKKVNSGSLAVHSNPPSSTADFNVQGSIDEHASCITAGSKVNVILGSEVSCGLLQPVIQGIQISPSFFACLNHRHHTESVFCPPVNSSDELLYKDVHHYQRKILPLIEMESAVCSITFNSACIQLSGVDMSWKFSGTSARGSFTILRTIFESNSLHISSGDYLCIRNDKMPSVNTTDKETKVFLTHGRVSQISEQSDRIIFHTDITEPSSTISEAMRQINVHKYTIEVIPQYPRYRSMIKAVGRLGDSPKIIRSIVTKRDLPGPPWKLDRPVLMYLPLDIDQVEAVKSALNSPFTVIYGQPGTGKTWTAVVTTCHFVTINWQSRAGQVLVCAPNNKALDVISKMLVKIPSVNVLRVYSRDDEEDPTAVIDACKPLALHLRVCRPENPHANTLIVCLHEIEMLKERLGLCEAAARGNLQQKLLGKNQTLAAILDAAEGFEFTQSSIHVILCTCADAADPRILKFAKISQCIVDECNMCIDAELLVPLVIAGQQSQHTVLIGDPKQLAPVLHSEIASRHGLDRFLFQDLIEGHSGKHYECNLLRMQFRMHPTLRACSTRLFYKDNCWQVFDSQQVIDSTILIEGLWPNSHEYRYVFCNVRGEEIFSKTGDPDAGRWNLEEVKKVVAVVDHIKSFSFRSEHICVISPYVNQRRRIKDTLDDKDIEITSPVESQGSEYQFVIFSTVRCNVLAYPGKIGCLGDVHQLNLVLTRARLGLIIIGDRKCLNTIPAWKRLLCEYESNGCVIDGSTWP